MTHPDGSVHWLAIQVQVYFEGERAARHSTVGFGTSQDITERKQAELELERQTEMLGEHAELLDLAHIVIRDRENRIIWWSKGAARLYGWAAEEVIGHVTHALLRTQFPESFDAYQTDLMTHDVWEDELAHITRAGARVVVASHQVLHRDQRGVPNRILEVNNDITTQKRIEEELRCSNAELEQFAYVASHDLQEPLRALAGMVQLLQQRYQDKLDALGQEFIKHAVEAALRMQTLINDLLAFSRVGTRGKPFAPTSVEKVLKALLLSLSVAIRESGAAITYDPLPTIMADELQIMQLLQNLIGNAIKFRGDQPPRIHLSAAQTPEGWQFAVRDNGIGIEAQYFERIFVVFQRLHTRREYPGTGIGLALCKKIVERHGGRIWVESQPKQGSTFYFTLPAAL
ncbi:sensory transduction histidine kinase [Candidatus Moduliflexus flocculans]|uniref:histidine kinase n=1 Tax=Candidatus Moduliflexus flocculans TaxID=1499966 RepID=A0A081BRL5_9BACT|nr:sensory transduction histidine kinase [Candidatus Moduliflexus flocculans]